MASYSEIYKKRMNELFKPKEEKKEEKEIVKEIKKEPVKIDFNEIFDNKKRKPRKLILFLLGLFFLLFIIYFLYSISKNSSPLLIILALVFIALFLFFIYKPYQKWIINVNKNLILGLVYLLLMANMVLGARVYSVEWAFLGFVILAIVLYDSKIDSRFLILPALLFLGYIPFLLIGKQNALAETIAVYVYYFLVVGVSLQLAEYIQKPYLSIDFDNFMHEIIKGANWITNVIIVGIISLAIIIANRFYELEIWKWTSVYVFALCLVFYLISNFKDK